MRATVTVTYHAAEVSRLNQRIAELEVEVHHVQGLRDIEREHLRKAELELLDVREQLEDEKTEAKRDQRKLAVAEACLKNVDDGWAYREYEERLYEEQL